MTRRRPKVAGDDRRSDARERALSLLYEAESKVLPPSDVVAAQIVPLDDRTAALVAGVESRRDELDRVIAAHAKGWTIERMPTLDRNILRIAAFELAALPDVPIAVVLDEAVELAKRFSTDGSGRFVNGVLSAIAPVLRGSPARATDNG